MKWIHRLFAVAAALPVLAWLGAIAGALYLSGVHDCRIDEGNVHPCTFLGTEIGDWAYLLGFYAAWGFLILIPLSMAILMAWGAFTIILAVVRRRRSPAE